MADDSTADKKTDQSAADKVAREVAEFCERMKVETKLRTAIADITASLNRSNLSAEEGERRAKSLVKAYGLLKEVEAESKRT